MAMRLLNSKFHSVLVRSLLCASLANYCYGETTGDQKTSEATNPGIPRNLYWGDTHLHTALSADAYGFGARLGLEEAYTFARGEAVTSNSGQTAQLRRPLDFLFVTDHAEYLGVTSLLDSNSEALQRSEIGQRWLIFMREAKNPSLNVPIMLDAQKVSTGALGIPSDKAFERTIWEQVTEVADAHNDPGNFTAFIGYEWSSLPDGNNLHRNIIYRDAASLAKQVLPFSAMDSRNPEDLWRYLEAYEAQTGGKVMAIPHNGNMSNGLMFRDQSFAGEPLGGELAGVRARWEPIIEVTQIKGDGETHPYLSPEDEFADFETWDEGNFAQPSVPKENGMLRYEYARSALRLGLEVESRLGVNPFRFGMIGSTDSHTALSAVEESNYFGKFAVDEPSPTRAHSDVMPASKYASAGYAAVWATENTREAIFDAMKRREVYASTGPRIMVRLFAAWDFDEPDATRQDFAAIGYRKGVPMGGDMGDAPGGKSPKFLVAASKDPMGANLDRVQIVKGWLDAAGASREKVYDVAMSGNRETTAIESAVNTDTATYANSTGEPHLATVWEDPDFDAGEHAFYYVRVFEIPTPRWTTYDSVRYKTGLPNNVPAQIQERAYSSPIWYTP